MESKTLKATFAIIAAFVTNYMIPTEPFIASLMTLIGVDWFTGIKAAKKRGEIITSTGLRKSVIKFRDYTLAVICAQLLQTVWLQNIPMTKMVSLYIALTEFQSILENLSVMRGKEIRMANIGAIMKIFKIK